MKNSLTLSQLGHTWIFDLDGTVVKHNGYLSEKGDDFLDGSPEFLRNIPEKDMIIFITSRKIDQKLQTEKFLSENNIRYDHIIFDAPYGERILVNDTKPGGLKTAICINTKRNEWADILVEENSNI